MLAASPKQPLRTSGTLLRERLEIEDESSSSEYLRAKIDYFSSQQELKYKALVSAEKQERTELILNPHKEWKRDLWYEKYMTGLREREELEKCCIGFREEDIIEVEEDDRLLLYESWLVDYRRILKTDQTFHQDKLKEQQEELERVLVHQKQEEERQGLLMDISEGLEAALRDERRTRQFGIGGEEETERNMIKLEYLSETVESIYTNHQRLHQKTVVEFARYAFMLLREEEVARRWMLSDEKLSFGAISLEYDRTGSERFWINQLTVKSHWGETLPLTPVKEYMKQQ